MALLNSWQKISRVYSGKPFGTRADGNATLSASSARATLTATASSPNATVGSTFLANGDVFAVHQTRGTGAGQWEFNRVKSGGGTTSIVCYENFHYSYVTGAQAIKIPMYAIATLSSYTVTAWDGTTGGVDFVCAGIRITGSGTLSFNGSNGASGGNNTAGATGGGFRGGRTSHTNPSQSYTGEGTVGASVGQSTANGNGGAGSNTSGPSGGGPGSGGGSANTGGGPAGGSSSSSADLLTINLGGGGGGGANDGSEGGNATGAGASGGGLLILIAPEIDISGMTLISLDGGAGGNAQTQAGEQSAGGGGGGGCCLLMCAKATLGTNKITASGGLGGINTTSGIRYGGTGSDGVIALHYSNSYTGSTTPSLNAYLDPSLKNQSPAAQVIGG